MSLSLDALHLAWLVWIVRWRKNGVLVVARWPHEFRPTAPRCFPSRRLLFSSENIRRIFPCLTQWTGKEILRARRNNPKSDLVDLVGTKKKVSCPLSFASRKTGFSSCWPWESQTMCEGRPRWRTGSLSLFFSLFLFLFLRRPMASIVLLPVSDTTTYNSSENVPPILLLS